MNKQTVFVLYVITMIAIIVSVDIFFLRDHAWLRLIVDVGIVLVFGRVLCARLEASMTGQPRKPVPGRCVFPPCRRQPCTSGPFLDRA
jgi:hypothetical protein